MFRHVIYGAMPLWVLAELAGSCSESHKGRKEGGEGNFVSWVGHGHGHGHGGISLFFFFLKRS